MFGVIGHTHSRTWHQSWSWLVLAAAGGLLHFLAGALHGELHHLLLTYVQYLLLLPTLTYLLPAYAFCNLHGRWCRGYRLYTGGKVKVKVRCRRRRMRRYVTSQCVFFFCWQCFTYSIL